MVDVVDPAGLVRSQAIEGEGGALRLTLNGAENRKTLAGHFIAESFGSSVQHLAFATGNIFASSARLDELGFSRLEISPNYYDDLEARFSLDPDLAERLKAANILYDRDATGGEYFQLYRPAIGEGFVFCDRRAARRLCRLRRAQRPLPHSGATASSSAQRHATKLEPFKILTEAYPAFAKCLSNFPGSIVATS